ncbi:hypothetical protein F2P81_019151 [Scophthalmus maximus]|uniref:Uncharacterized protein n=1 Tax=Scophthalmus maximus TaxID=52904 RepID=A0A6A4SB74_SCOMX|nr:hypothetical protein F2P81_019151 [Scophthalmus maximus]
MNCRSEVLFIRDTPPERNLERLRQQAAVHSREVTCSRDTGQMVRVNVRDESAATDKVLVEWWSIAKVRRPERKRRLLIFL